MVIILLGAISYIIWSNIQNQNNLNPQKVIVNIFGLKGPSSIGMIKMFEEKPVIGENVETNYQIAQTPDDMVAKLLSNEADIAVLPTNVAAIVYNKGQDYKLAAVSGWGVLYILSIDESIKSWDDIKGKTINIIGRGSNPDVIFRYLSAQNGINPEKDVILDYTLGQVDLAQTMIAGKSKLGILPEPFVTMVLEKNKNAKIILDIQEEWKKAVGKDVPIALTSLVIKGEFAKNYPKAVENFLIEYKKSIDWVNNNKDQAGTLVEKHGVGIQAQIAEAAIPRTNLKFEEAQQAKDAVKNYLKILYDFSPKDIGGKMPDESFYYKK